MKKDRFLLMENKNLKAYGNLENEKVEIELKPDCDKRVRRMWKQLNEPIRRKKKCDA
nr:MAG TPA: hypothetical protein [Caudoviricetes sp.]